VSVNERLLTEYIAEHRSGGDADPRLYLNRVPDADRVELAALIDGYLARAPRAAFDPNDYKSSPASTTAQGLERSFRGSSGLWPALLPRLRAQAGLDPSQLAGRLAAQLGAAHNESKVGAYYEQMERGTLPPAGVSSHALETLAAIVDRSPAALAEAGMIGSSIQPEVAADDEWDETDVLFRGG
jgi:hypothetical protein